MEKYIYIFGEVQGIAPFIQESLTACIAWQSAFSHELPHDTVNVAVGGESETERPAQVQGSWPATHDAHRAFVRFTADAGSDGRTTQPFQAGQHLRGRDTQAGKVD